ncbi:hypothetical protein BDV26DRAFT_264191 [Aspergillus bertholletiae]|uniref:NAD(P)-binding domain-containing protein n=1 Tax=Aspergillus bertholletiae TaxID=1226010 RepID=A0A5N7B555_9EURO|nr:hypothetical protein BDV26DRAFT_264191 [Aspergillus bertholletiae]
MKVLVLGLARTGTSCKHLASLPWDTKITITKQPLSPPSSDWNIAPMTGPTDVCSVTSLGGLKVFKPNTWAMTVLSKPTRWTISPVTLTYSINTPVYLSLCAPMTERMNL